MKEFRDIGGAMFIIQYFLKDIKKTKLALKKYPTYLKAYTNDVNSIIHDAKKIKKEIES